MMLILLIASTLTVALNIQSVRASGTIYIRPDGSVEGTDKIQKDGDTYTFTDDIYDEIVVERNDVVIEGKGYMLQGPGIGHGIRLFSVQNVTVQNTFITGFWFGVHLKSSSNNVISRNNVTNNLIGVLLNGSCHYNSITRNNLTLNRGDGIRLRQSSENNEIAGNTATANNIGIQLERSSNNNHIAENTLVQNGMMGMWVNDSSNNTISKNDIANTDELGVWVTSSENNTVFENRIRNSGAFGIYVQYCSHNSFYHNSLEGNRNQVFAQLSQDLWDDGYPSGGNYWSDHVTVDDYSGPNQDELGSDGIVDEPYIINADNRDHYPLAQPWSAAILASLDTSPDTLNLNSHGKLTTAYVELPEAYDVYGIDVSSIMLNGTVPAETEPTAIGDFDNDEIPDLMVKFDRAAVESFILDHINLREVVKARFTTVTLTITGELTDGTPFQGSDTIKIVCTVPQKL